MEFKNIREELYNKPTSASSLNYLNNNYIVLQKLMTHLSKTLQSNNGQAVRSDLKDIGCICSSMLKNVNNLLNHLQHYY